VFILQNLDMLTANDKQIRKPTATTVCFKQFNSLVRFFYTLG